MWHILEFISSVMEVILAPLLGWKEPYTYLQYRWDKFLNKIVGWIASKFFYSKIISNNSYVDRLIFLIIILVVFCSDESDVSSQSLGPLAWPSEAKFALEAGTSLVFCFSIIFCFSILFNKVKRDKIKSLTLL